MTHSSATRAQLALLTLLTTLLPTGEALALKLHVEMTPDRLGESFSVEVTPLEGGRSRFVIRRDLANSSQPTNPALHLERGASLHIHGEEGLIARCGVAAETDDQGRLVYRFELDQEHARRSRLVYSEIEEYKQAGRSGYIGGGTIYSFRLIRFFEPGRSPEGERLVPAP